MNIYGFLGHIPDSCRVVTIELSNGMVNKMSSRTSLSSYLWDYNNYFYIYLDEESRKSRLYSDILEILKNREEVNVFEYPLTTQTD